MGPIARWRKWREKSNVTQIDEYELSEEEIDKRIALDSEKYNLGFTARVFKDFNPYSFGTFYRGLVERVWWSCHNPKRFNTKWKNFFFKTLLWRDYV